ncbi:TIGR00295 family protein [Candidatus Hecatella orcuttiae]|uniref:TIGR00295 family protein n=1 Tax=Candidatus Hecatella orcuttiae TaxID=1935119 RepID=UPI002867B752|nr:TIGR00295 family protein [Candidatus Hecatella orcuttiae]
MNNLPGRKEAEAILKKVGCSEEVINHARAVTKLALKLAETLRSRGLEVNLKLVEAGGLLHDLGRCRTHGVKHGFIGGEISRTLGLPQPLVNIVERHVGAGIPAEEAAELGLPARDFIPQTWEEKIIAYADKLVMRNKVIDFEEALKELSRSLGENHPALGRFRKLHREISENLNQALSSKRKEKS